MPHHESRSLKNLFTLLVMTGALALVPACLQTPVYAGNTDPLASPDLKKPGKDLHILQSWSGDYPVDQLDRLPDSQRKERVGYIVDAAVFASLWQAFKPGEEVPEVDFKRHLILFARNVDFYNRTSIGKVTLEDGVAKILTMETLSAIPIEDKVSMALVVIPRDGVNVIGSGEIRIPLESH